MSKKTSYSLFFLKAEHYSRSYNQNLERREGEGDYLRRDSNTPDERREGVACSAITTFYLNDLIYGTLQRTSDCMQSDRMQYFTN